MHYYNLFEKQFLKVSLVIILSIYLTQILIKTTLAPTTVFAGESTKEIRVLVVSFLPADFYNTNNLSFNETQINSSITSMRQKVKNLTEQGVKALTEASKYHGYKDSVAPSYLNYKVIENKEYLLPLPKSTFGSPVQPDYRLILNDLNICYYVDDLNVKQVWLWGYHTKEISPVESNMSMGTNSKQFWNHGNYGDVSNSSQIDDLPTCKKTYNLYNYSYSRGLGEMLEDHGHQIEATSAFVDNDLWQKFQKPYGNEDSLNRCGWTHSPPNSRTDYDWSNPKTVQSDCQDWRPDGSGQIESVSCKTWSKGNCTQDGGEKFKIWWMQNLPGYGSNLLNKNSFIRNWWEFYEDFDTALAYNKSFSSQIPSNISSTCLGNTDCIKGVSNCYKDLGLSEPAPLIACINQFIPKTAEDINTIDEEIKNSCNGDTKCIQDTKNCIIGGGKTVLECVPAKPRNSQTTPSTTSSQATIPTKPSTASSGGSVKPSTTSTNKTKINSKLELSISGDTAPNLNHYPGEKVNLGIKLYNNNLSPNNGCPITTKKIIFKINGQEVLQAISCQAQAFTIPDLTATETTKTFTFSGEFEGDELLGPGSSELTFIVTKNPWIKTNAIAHINGLPSITITGDTQSVNIGARITTDGQYLNCIVNNKQYLTLKLIKTADENGNILNQTVKQIDDADNCQSYPTELAGAGNYILDVNFNSQGKMSYQAAHVTGQIKVSPDTKQPTKTSLDISINSMGDDPSINLAPKVTINGNCQLENIGFVGLTVKTSASDTGYLEVPNCTTTIKKLTDFIQDSNKLKGLTSLTFNAKYLSTSDSPWGPSSSEPKTITLQRSGTSSQTSSSNNPDTNEINQKPTISFDTDPSGGNTTITLTATTSLVASQPKFNLNGTLLDPNKPSEEGCKTAKGTCTYQLFIDNLNGDYEVKFCLKSNTGCSDTLTFTNKSADTNTKDPHSNKTIKKAFLKIPGLDEIEIDGNSPKSIHLGGSGTIVGQITFIYADDTKSSPQTIKFQIESENEEQESKKIRENTCIYEENLHLGEDFSDSDKDKCKNDKGHRQCTGIKNGDSCTYDQSGSVNPNCEIKCDNGKAPKKEESDNTSENNIDECEFLGCSTRECGEEKYRCLDGSIDYKINIAGNCGQSWANSVCESKKKDDTQTSCELKNEYPECGGGSDCAPEPGQEYWIKEFNSESCGEHGNYTCKKTGNPC